MSEEITRPKIPRMKDVPRNLKQYFIGWLVKGARWNDTEGADAAALMPLHLAFLRTQIEADNYALAGPMLDGDRIVGLIIFNTKTADEALAIANEDPAVKTGRLAVEVHPAYLPSLDALHIEY